MPVTPADFNAVEPRDREITLGSDGSIKGIIRERTSGQEIASGTDDAPLDVERGFSARSSNDGLHAESTAARLDKITRRIASPTLRSIWMLSSRASELRTVDAEIVCWCSSRSHEPDELSYLTEKRSSVSGDAGIEFV
jgi:hypothetical protein